MFHSNLPDSMPFAFSMPAIEDALFCSRQMTNSGFDTGRPVHQERQTTISLHYVYSGWVSHTGFQPVDKGLEWTIHKRLPNCYHLRDALDLSEIDTFNFFSFRISEAMFNFLSLFSCEKERNASEDACGGRGRRCQVPLKKKFQ